MAKQQAVSVNTWKKAKAAKDYSMFKPELQKLVDLNVEAAEILMKVKQTKTPYDALLDIYEPKMTAEATAKVFTRAATRTENASNEDCSLQESS